MLGVIVNALAIIAGGGVGLLLKGGIKHGTGAFIMQGLALCTGVLAIQNALAARNIIIVIVAIVAGGLIGSGLDIDKRINWLGEKAQEKLKGQGNFAQGFVTATLLFCVGSMTVMGSLNSGLRGDHTILFAKSALDGVAALIFASTLGVGVLGSAASVFVFQGLIVLFASFLQPFLSDAVVAEMTGAGGVIMLGLSLSMLKILDIKVANFLPSIFLPIVFVPLLALIGGN